MMRTVDAILRKRGERQCAENRKRNGKRSEHHRCRRLARSSLCEGHGETSNLPAKPKSFARPRSSCAAASAMKLFPRADFLNSTSKVRKTVGDAGPLACTLLVRR